MTRSEFSVRNHTTPFSRFYRPLIQVVRFLTSERRSQIFFIYSSTLVFVRSTHDIHTETGHRSSHHAVSHTTSTRKCVKYQTAPRARAQECPCAANYFFFEQPARTVVVQIPSILRKRRTPQHAPSPKCTRCFYSLALHLPLGARTFVKWHHKQTESAPSARGSHRPRR